MTLLYRILGVIINIFSFFIAIALVIIVPASLAIPPLWLPVFMFVAIVLYTWFSNRFQKLVLVRHEPVRASLRDWIRVNGFVAVISSILNIPPLVALLRNPTVYIASMSEALDRFGPQYRQNFRPESLTTIAVVIFVFQLALLIHVLWTFALMKKNQQYFQ